MQPEEPALTRSWLKRIRLAKLSFRPPFKRALMIASNVLVRLSQIWKMFICFSIPSLMQSAASVGLIQSPNWPGDEDHCNSFGERRNVENWSQKAPGSGVRCVLRVTHQHCWFSSSSEAEALSLHLEQCSPQAALFCNKLDALSLLNWLLSGYCNSVTF